MTQLYDTIRGYSQIRFGMYDTECQIAGI